MKRFLLVFLSLLALQSFAAESPVYEVAEVVEVTPTFLGIPIDGPKSLFVAKLNQKGFVDSDHDGWLEGHFAGRDVSIFLITNRDNEVSVVRVQYAHVKSEQSFVNIYNELFDELYETSKYSYGEGRNLSLNDVDEIMKNPNNEIDYRKYMKTLAGFSFKYAKAGVYISVQISHNGYTGGGIKLLDIFLNVDYVNFYNMPDSDL